MTELIEQLGQGVGGGSEPGERHRPRASGTGSQLMRIPSISLPRIRVLLKFAICPPPTHPGHRLLGGGNVGGDAV